MHYRFQKEKKRIFTLGIIVSEIENDFLFQTIEGIESIAVEKGFHTIVMQNNEFQNSEKSNIEYLIKKGVDGLLISVNCTSQNTKYLQSLNKKIPVVFFKEVNNEIKSHKVIVNNYKAALMAVEHLIRSGCNKILFITCSVNKSTIEERMEGYKEALNKHKISYKKNLINCLVYDTNITVKVENIITGLFDGFKKPDAIFMADEKITLVCMGVLKKIHLENIALTGFTNSDLTCLFSPEFTAIRQPAFEIGQAATELLINIINRKRSAVAKTIVLETELILNKNLH